MFIAAFDSDCENCDELLERGQEAVMVDYRKSLVAHKVCPNPRPARPVPTCPECHLQHAGEC